MREPFSCKGLTFSEVPISFSSDSFGQSQRSETFEAAEDTLEIPYQIIYSQCVRTFFAIFCSVFAPIARLEKEIPLLVVW